MKTERRWLYTTATMLVLSLVTAVVAADKERSRGSRNTMNEGGERTVPAANAELRSAVGPVLPPAPVEGPILEKVFRRFPEADRSQVLAFLRENFADDMYQFNGLAVHSEEQAVTFLSDAVRRVLPLLAARDSDPDLYGKLLRREQLSRRAQWLAELCRKTEGKVRENYETQLRETLAEAFDVKQVLMKQEVEQMESQIVRLKELVEKREANKAAVVDRRMAELTGRTDPLQW